MDTEIHLKKQLAYRNVMILKVASGSHSPCSSTLIFIPCKLTVAVLMFSTAS